MNGIDDLRRTLAVRADDVTSASGDRAASVSSRIGAARRRRRVAVVGGVAAAVAVTAGALVLPDRATRDTGPAPAVFGIDVPPQIDALGFRYVLRDVVEGEDGRARVELAASDVPRLVSWATSGSDDRVEVDSTGLTTVRSFDSVDFDDWTYLAAGGDASVSVTAQSGDPGLAVYELDPAVRPEGLTVDGVTFRDEAAGGSELGAAIGAAGDPEVEVAGLPAGTRVDVGSFCSGGPARAWTHLEVGGEEVSFGPGCDEQLPVDATTTVTGTMTLGPVGTARFYVTDGRNGPLVDDPDLRIGLAFYRPSPRRSLGPGLSWPERIEVGARSWRLDSVRAADEVGPDGAVVGLPAGAGPRLAFPAWAGTGESLISVRIDGRDVSNAFSVGSGGIPGVRFSGSESLLQVEAEGAPLTDEAQVGLGVYVPED